jgi:folate-dependent tRNA-U54 methylase TrmFO/GidA
MTVKLGMEKIPWPLSAFIGLLVTVLLAAGGWAAYAIQKGADVEHKLLAQQQEMFSDRLTHDEEFITGNTLNNSTLITNMGVLKEGMRNIENMLSDIQRRIE